VSADIIRKELKEMTEGMEVKFLVPFNIQFEDDINVYITLRSIKSGIVNFTVGEFKTERHIDQLDFKTDFDILYRVYNLTKLALQNRSFDEKEKLKGERKSDR
jgi:hypothetical protein